MNSENCHAFYVRLMLKMNRCVTSRNRGKFLSLYGFRLLQQETLKRQKAKVRSIIDFKE